MPRGIVTRPKVHGWPRTVLDMYTDNILFCYMGGEEQNGGYATDLGPLKNHGVYGGTEPGANSPVGYPRSRAFNGNDAAGANPDFLNLKTTTFVDRFNPNKFSIVIWARLGVAWNSAGTRYLFSVSYDSNNNHIWYKNSSAGTLIMRATAGGVVSQHSVPQSGVTLWCAHGLTYDAANNVMSAYSNIPTVVSFIAHSKLSAPTVQGTTPTEACIGSSVTTPTMSLGSWKGQILPAICWSNRILTDAEMQIAMTA